MFEGLRNARRRTKQALFEKGAQNSEHVPITDITILSETLEEIQELQRANEQVGQSAKGLADAIDQMSVHFERVALAASVLPGSEFDDKKALLRGHLRQKLENAKQTLEASNANGLHSYVEQYQGKDIEKRIASLKQRLGEVQQLRLDFDAYRRKVAQLDQRVFAGDAASPETVKLQATQQDKHKKLAAATASFDKSFKTLLSDMQYCYREMGGRLYDSTRTYLLAQTACLYTLGSAFDDYIVPMEAPEEEDLSSCLFELRSPEKGAVDDLETSKAYDSQGPDSFISRDTVSDASARTPVTTSRTEDDNLVTEKLDDVEDEEDEASGPDDKTSLGMEVVDEISNDADILAEETEALPGTDNATDETISDVYLEEDVDQDVPELEPFIEKEEAHDDATVEDNEIDSLNNSVAAMSIGISSRHEQEDNEDTDAVEEDQHALKQLISEASDLVQAPHPTGEEENDNIEQELSQEQQGQQEGDASFQSDAAFAPHTPSKEQTEVQPFKEGSN